MNITGSAKDDILNGTFDADSIVALGDDDVIFDGDGNDTVLGGHGNDYISATGHNDDDIFNGGLGYDLVSYTDVTGPVTINLATQTVTGAATEPII